MAQPNGTKAVKCPYCGAIYHLNNFNRRWPGKRTLDGKLLDDTHLIACYRKQHPEWEG